ncbi:MAG: hypothetical protein ACMUHY_01805 [Thermoplasmatota archaeon]
MKADVSDLRVFLLLMAISSICQVIVTPFLLNEPQLFVNWIAIPIHGGLGYIGMRFFLREAGPKGMMDVPGEWRQYLFPAIAGLLFGVLATGFDMISETKVPQLPFPLSIPAYIPVAIMDNMFWKLFIMTMVVYMVSGRLFKGRKQEAVYWGMAVVYSIVYMMIQFGQYAALVGEITPVTVVQIFIVSGGFILTSCWAFRRWGFLAAVIMHISQYLLYHGVYGGLS